MNNNAIGTRAVQETDRTAYWPTGRKSRIHRFAKIDQHQFGHKECQIRCISQSVNDIDHLSRGMNYGRLPESYVIFICMFDPFQDEMPRYEFRELCRENPEIELNDGTHKVFINAKYVKTDISDEMRALFDYLCGKEPASELTQEIDASIIRAKRERRWERDYVQFIEKLEEAEMAGRKAMAELNLFLIEQDRIEDLKKASEDPDYLEAVFDEMRAAGRIDTDRSE